MAEKILIVDDDADTVKFISLMLTRMGYETLSALNGREALEQAHSQHPDLIIMDVMMPGLDGFEVTRTLRRHPETATTPILMFTAKTQVDDKLTGYDAGVNIYLTKPIHPIDLQANIKTLLAQKHTRVEVASEKGYVIGVMAAKGGQGVSTIALNLALAYHQKNQVKVIAAECKPGQGAWAQELNLADASGLASMLRKDVTELTQPAVNNALVPIIHRINLLLASNDLKDVTLVNANAQFEAVLQHLSQLAALVVLDIGTSFHPALEQIIHQCNEIILVTDPHPNAVKHTQNLANALRLLNFGSAKALTIVTLNRTRSDLLLSVSQVEKIVGKPVSLGFPPANELSYIAANQFVPMIISQPEGTIAQQFNNLADQVKLRLSSL
jgi:DNA-binding response OmpR family regulator